MTVKRKFTEDRGIYGRVEAEGFAIDHDNPFVAMRNAAGVWTVFHARTGLVVEKLLPARMMRSKRWLLQWLADMAVEQPEAVAMLSLVESADMLAGDFREYGQALIDWSGKYVCN